VSVNKELKLVAKIADTGELRQVLDAGITVDAFADHDARLIFEYLTEFFRSRSTRGNVPTRDMIWDVFPTVDLPEEDRMTISAAIQEFRNHDISLRLGKLSRFLGEWVDEPDEALPHLEREVKEMMSKRRTSTDIVVSENMKEAVARYEEAERGLSMRGIPYPWEPLNEETQGMQDGEYIILYGRPKSLKTWVALYCCVHAYNVSRQKVLIYTREMSPAVMRDRCICLLIGAPYSALKKGYLHEIPYPLGGTMRDAFYTLMDGMYADEKTTELETGKGGSLIITSDRDDRKFGGGVQGLHRKCEDHKPGLVFVDAVYLMRNDREGGKRSMKWNDQGAISQDLKDLAQDINRPLIATLQANRESEDRKGKTSANMAFSDSYAQDCDLSIELIKKRINAEQNLIAAAITASREANIAGFVINGNPGSDFNLAQRQVVGAQGTPTDVYEDWVFQDVSEIKDMFSETTKTKSPKNTDRVTSALSDAWKKEMNRRGSP